MIRYRRGMKLAWCAVAACVIGCGKGSGSSGAGSGSAPPPAPASAAPAPPPVDAAAPVAPAEPPKPAQTFTDAPLGKGACKLIGIKEASEIVGVQLAYTDAEPDLCHLEAGDVQLTVQMPQGPQEMPDKWKVDGIGEKASWDFVDGLIFIVGGKTYRVALTDVSQGTKTRALNLELAKKVLVHLGKK